MFTVAVPIAAVPLAISVIVLVFFVGFGLNNAVTPLGKPDADRLTLPLKPFCGVIVTVIIPVVPCTIVRLAGEAESA
jgi:hypothetical protein